MTDVLNLFTGIMDHLMLFFDYEPFRLILGLIILTWTISIIIGFTHANR